MRGLGIAFGRVADGLLTPERVRRYALVFVVLGALLLVGSAARRVLDPAVSGAVLPDYLAHWTGGRIVLAGGGEGLYDPLVQSAVQVAALGPTSRLAYFVSPPPVAVAYLPLALLDYGASAAVWAALSAAVLAGCLLALRLVAPSLMRRRGGLVVLVLLASAPVLELSGGGQDSAMVLGVWLGGLELLRRRSDLLAGMVLGLGVLKPQLVVLVPLLLLLTRRRAALAGFAGSAGVLLAVGVQLQGWQSLGAWLGALASPLYAEQVQQGQAWKMVSLPSLVAGILPPRTAEEWGPALGLGFLVAGASALAWRLRSAGATGGGASGRDILPLWSCALATTVVFSPHLVVYDAVLLFPVALHLLERRSSKRLRVTLLAAFWLTWLAPALHILGRDAPWPLAAVDAPWSAIPLLLLWVETMRDVGSTYAVRDVSVARRPAPRP